jgi:hypothetical protein
VKTPINFEYLRLLEDGTPAAGKFNGWPEKTAEITVLDPCMGSGHFVVSLFTVFANLRMLEEGLSKEEATDKVITENLHGLELDARCTQIAAFNLALTAWKFCGKYIELPEMNLACSGLAPKGKVEDWVKLVGKENNENDKFRLENGMRLLYKYFQLAPELGSLIDPTIIEADLHTASFDQLHPVLKKALDNETDKDIVERGVLAAGIAKAGLLLSKKYTLQITNVPYLSRSKQDAIISNYCETHFKEAKGDLATVFLEKMLKSTIPGGISCSVIPQNWLFQTSYKKFREKLLKHETWNTVARLGFKGFQTPMWDFNVMLISLAHSKPSVGHLLIGIDVSDAPNAYAKDLAIKIAELKTVKQKDQLDNPDAAITFNKIENSSIQLHEYFNCFQGLRTGDLVRFVRNFWETSYFEKKWDFFQTTGENGKYFSGLSCIIFWENANGELFKYAKETRYRLHDMHESGNLSWGKKGIAISQMAGLTSWYYSGEKYDSTLSAITAKKNDKSIFESAYAYLSSNEYFENVRNINQGLYVTNSTLLKVPFNLDHWQKIGIEKFPNGLPKPYTNDPKQWLFHGNPSKADHPLQVAVARLLGYSWPAESDTEMELSDDARQLIDEIKMFDHLFDNDGIICIPSVNAEETVADRLRDYLKEVFGKEWTNNTPSQLLATENAKSTNLESWLRNEFFIQHH